MFLIGHINTLVNFDGILNTFERSCSYSSNRACRGRLTDNLEYDWLTMMSLNGAVVIFYHATGNGNL